MGLLAGKDGEAYKKFFTMAKDFKCPSFPILLSGFELVIQNTARAT